jgi:hypothetical protein
MQPSDDQRRTEWAPQSTGGYARPSYAPAPPAMSVTNARPWPIALAATATMLVLILAVDNSSLSDKIARHALDSNGFFSRALVALTAFRWDLGRLSPDPDRLYLGQLLADIAVLVLVLLLVAVVTRGRGSFWQVFVASWLAVIVASQIGTYVRSSVVKSDQVVAAGGDRPTVIFFSVYSPGAVTLFASIAFGLVVALVAGFVGVRTRRVEVVSAPAEPTGAAAAPEAGEAPARREPWSAPPAAVPGPVSNPSPWTSDSSDADDRTTQLPPVEQRPQHGFDDGEQHTTQLPPVDDDRPPR